MDPRYPFFNGNNTPPPYYPFPYPQQNPQNSYNSIPVQNPSFGYNQFQNDSYIPPMPGYYNTQDFVNLINPNTTNDYLQNVNIYGKPPNSNVIPNLYNNYDINSPLINQISNPIPPVHNPIRSPYMQPTSLPSVPDVSLVAPMSLPVVSASSLPPTSLSSPTTTPSKTATNKRKTKKRQLR